MSIYETLTDSFLAARNLLPESKWDDRIRATIDEHFKEAAVSVYSNPIVLSNIVKSDYITKIDKNIAGIYESKGLEYPEKFPLTKMLLDLKFDFPLMNVFGMALANGDIVKIGQTWGHCVHAIWNEFLKCIISEPERENTLRICKILDLVHEFESVMIDLEYFSYNYVPLSGIDFWIGDITELVNNFLTHEDVLDLSKTSGCPPLVTIHSSVPMSSWLACEFEKGWRFLANNSNLPAEVVNKVLLKKEWGLSDAVLLHPNADSEIAINWVLEVLDSGDGESLINSLSQWDNVRDDGFNNFNSFRSTSKSGKKVLSTIKKWCRNNPDEGEEIYEILFGE
jgi:hypothetical protein